MGDASGTLSRSATRPADQIPVTKSSTVAAACTGRGKAIPKYKKGMLAKDPHVPGAFGKSPDPNHVPKKSAKMSVGDLNRSHTVEDSFI